MSCTGTGAELDPELIKERIEELNDMILGMQTRLRTLSDFIKLANKGYLPNLAQKYTDRLELCSCGLGRLLNYKRKLISYASNR
jgi:hypothetical protein